MRAKGSKSVLFCYNLWSTKKECRLTSLPSGTEINMSKNMSFQYKELSHLNLAALSPDVCSLYNSIV